MGDFINTVLAFLGTAGIMGLFIFLMINKYGWKMTQIVAGFILAMMVAVNFPKMPAAVNDGVVGIINSLK